MPNTQYKEEFEQCEIDLLQACRRQLIEERKLVLTDDGYTLTEKGRNIVQKELARYDMRPAMALLIQQYVLEMNNVEVR